MNSRPAAALTFVLLIAGSAATAGEVRIFLNGLYNLSSLKYSDSRTVTEFAETGSLDTSYEGKKGPGVEGGFQYNFTRSLGAAASFAWLGRDATASYSASLPHPLYLNQPRKVSGDVDGLKFRETAVHVDLVVGGRSGSLRFGVFAGPSFFKIEGDLLDRITYSHTYPYDTVTVTGTPLVKGDDNPIGFNAGGGLDYVLGAHGALGIQARFSRSKAELAADQGVVKVDVGGLDVAFGVRIYF